MSRRTRAVPAPEVPVKKPHADGWQNFLSGLGTIGIDKRLGSNFTADLVSQESAEQIWRGDDMFARAVEAIPNEMLREDFEVKVQEDGETGEKIDEAHRELGTVETLRTGLYYARAFGGAGIYLGADDGVSDLSKPLQEDRIRSFKWMTVYTPRELQPATYYSDPFAPKYGEIATYRLSPLNTPPGGKIVLPEVHESRIVRIPGVETTKRAQLSNVHPGWNDSILVRLMQIINDFQAAWQGAAMILSDFATPTLKLKGLAEALASTPDGQLTILQKARMVELCRSTARVTVIDSEEEYKRETTNVAGLADLLDKTALRLAAAIPMPVSLLMGQSPAGLNATGDADIRWFYDQIKAEQKRKLKPALKRITQVMLLAKEGPCGGVEPKNWNVEFPELWQLTEAEQVKAHLDQAQADAVYVQNQVVTPEEIAKSRFGGDAYSTRTVIDVELRDQMAAEADHQQNRLDPEPVVDPNVAAKLAATAPLNTPPGAKGAK